jgi:hypothetical protein
MLLGRPQSQTVEESEELLDNDPEMPLEGDFAISSGKHGKDDGQSRPES